MSSGIHKTAIGDAGLELVTKQADANVIDTTQVAQADADLQQGEAPAQKDLNIALADDAKAEASTDAAAQLLHDQLDAAASKLASTVETTAAAVQSHALAVATTGLWTAKAAQQVNSDSAVAASADAATASYAPLAHFLSDRASAMVSWTSDLVSHYVTYIDAQNALVATESSSDAIAQQTDSGEWAAIESSASQQAATSRDTHDSAVPAADAAFAQGVAPLTVAYQTALAAAQRAFIVGQATAQRALTLGGTQATFDSSVLSLKTILGAAQQSAAAVYSSAEFPFEKADRAAWLTADKQLAIDANNIDADRQTAEAEADKSQSHADIQSLNSRAVNQAVLDLGYTVWKASGLESTLTALAAAHSSPWATEQKATASDSKARTSTVANALSAKDTELANLDETQQLAASDAQTTLQEDSVSATRTASNSRAIAAFDRALAELNADEALNHTGSYNALLPQKQSAFSITTADSLDAQRANVANQPGGDGYFSNGNSQMYRYGGNNYGFTLLSIRGPELQESEDFAQRTAGDTIAPLLMAGNLHQNLIFVKDGPAKGDGIASIEPSRPALAPQALKPQSVREEARKEALAIEARYEAERVKQLAEAVEARVNLYEAKYYLQATAGYGVEQRKELRSYVEKEFALQERFANNRSWGPDSDALKEWLKLSAERPEFLTKAMEAAYQLQRRRDAQGNIQADHRTADERFNADKAYRFQRLQDKVTSGKVMSPAERQEYDDLVLNMRVDEQIQFRNKHGWLWTKLNPGFSGLGNFDDGVMILLPGTAWPQPVEFVDIRGRSFTPPRWLPQRVAPAPPRQTLLTELSQQGVKYTPRDVVAIARDASGRIVFLETGNVRAGLQHIVQEHAAQFAERGITEAQIPDAVMAAATRGRQVGMQGTRPIFEVEFNGQTQRIAVTVGNNGFIVGANPAGQ